MAQTMESRKGTLMDNHGFHDPEVGEKIIDALSSIEKQSVEKLKQMERRKVEIMNTAASGYLEYDYTETEVRDTLSDMMDYALKSAEFCEAMWNEFWHGILCRRGEQQSQDHTYAIRTDPQAPHRLVLVSSPVRDY